MQAQVQRSGEFGGAFTETTSEQINLISRVNLEAVMDLTLRAMPGMLERRRAADPDAYPELTAGVLEVAVVDGDGRFARARRLRLLVRAFAGAASRRGYRLEKNIWVA